MKLLTCLLTLWIATPATTAITSADRERPRKYAVYKAHTILPGSLRFLVQKNGRSLFAGLALGLKEPSIEINENRILLETRKISNMVNSHKPFRDVVFQMGFVSGLLAVHTDPARNSPTHVRNGFDYYLNWKLHRYHFVFDGYRNLATSEQNLLAELRRLNRLASVQQGLLVDRYNQVNRNSFHPFSERSAVFGVCSLYYSNVARVSAHLWYYAWSQANGDLTETPFVEPQRTLPRGW